MRSLPREDSELPFLQIGTAVDTELEQRVEFALVERRALGSSLHLDEQPAAGDDDVHIGLCANILDICQIEHGLTVDDADGDSCDRVQERRGVLADELLRTAPLD